MSSRGLQEPPSGAPGCGPTGPWGAVPREARGRVQPAGELSGGEARVDGAEQAHREALRHDERLPDLVTVRVGPKGRAREALRREDAGRTDLLVGEVRAQLEVRPRPAHAAGAEAACTQRLRERGLDVPQRLLAREEAWSLAHASEWHATIDDDY